MSASKSGRAAAFESIGHYAAGIAVLFKGIDKASHFGEHPVLTSIILVLGVVMLAAALMHHRLAAAGYDPRAVLGIGEGCALVAVAWALQALGSGRLSLLYAFVAVCFIVIGAFHGLVPAAERPRMVHRLRLGLGALFLCAAGLFASSWVVDGRGAAMRVVETLFFVAGAGLVIAGLWSRRGVPPTGDPEALAPPVAGAAPAAEVPTAPHAES